MKNVLAIKTGKPVTRNVSNSYIDAEQLHELLPVAATYVMTFRSEKKLASYRRMLYSVNGQGTFRYRTLRDEHSAYGLAIWRMK